MNPTMVGAIHESPLGGGRRAFGDMSPEARERYLLGWADSRLGLRRSAFGAFRKLMTFLGETVRADAR